MPDDTGGNFSACELDRLADLYLRFEGTPDPLSRACKEAEQEFDLLVDRVYVEKIAPKHPSVSLLTIQHRARIYCRKRWAKHGAPFPCIQPEVPAILEDSFEDVP
ncbi:MAG TPA: hypothetical protein VK731_11295 [Candidatus Cybelea sp.]|jgi:hypothetical protein|nr:hypothetical protein [Candidatus Cybelea sp.]